MSDQSANTSSGAINNTTATPSAATPSAATPTQLQTITVPEGQRYIARVKWFDNTLSYGFATVTSGEHAGRDIFVHQSNILTLAQGIYRTLRMGEYIEFNLEENTDSSHRYQAIAVTGPDAGQLMCESNPRRPRVQQQVQQPVQQQTHAPAVGQQPRQSVNGNRQNRRGNQQYQGGYRNQAPIQVVVEYPNPPRSQYRRQRQPRNQSTAGQTSSQSAAANIAATLAAGN
jgi:cold shock CspA family protein